MESRSCHGEACVPTESNRPPEGSARDFGILNKFYKIDRKINS